MIKAMGNSEVIYTSLLTYSTSK